MIRSKPQQLNNLEDFSLSCCIQPFSGYLPLPLQRQIQKIMKTVIFLYVFCRDITDPTIAVS